MNRIGLIISGTLTGFSRFYATDNVKELDQSIDLDFDYRKYVTFLETGDKVYSIAFSPAVITISLITRILDSFRRPGTLVVSLLIPRDTRLESITGIERNQSTYQVLNEINNRFKEINIENGMAIQNIAILKVDHYSDILNRYTLREDAGQRKVNRLINTATNLKKVGYIRSNENDVALYLASPYRRNYEGYHYIFIANNAPQNLNEPPVEEELYDVEILNRPQRFSGVRLTDRIPTIEPEEGEIDIEKNFTYQQVLNHESEQIQAELDGETIRLQYRFSIEKKEIRFEFWEKNQKFDANLIKPFLFDGKTKRMIYIKDSALFEGKDIYKIYTLNCGNTYYEIEQRNRQINVSKLRSVDIYRIEVVNKYSDTGKTSVTDNQRVQTGIPQDVITSVSKSRINSNEVHPLVSQNTVPATPTRTSGREQTNQTENEQKKASFNKKLNIVFLRGVITGIIFSLFCAGAGYAIFEWLTNKNKAEGPKEQTVAKSINVEEEKQEQEIRIYLFDNKENNIKIEQSADGQPTIKVNITDYDGKIDEEYLYPTYGSDQDGSYVSFKIPCHESGIERLVSVTKGDEQLLSEPHSLKVSNPNPNYIHKEKIVLSPAKKQSNISSGQRNSNPQNQGNGQKTTDNPSQYLGFSDTDPFLLDKIPTSIMKRIQEKLEISGSLINEENDENKKKVLEGYNKWRQILIDNGKKEIYEHWCKKLSDGVTYDYSNRSNKDYKALNWIIQQAK